MRVLVAGKYPPVQGGTSNYLYWMTRRLADLRHEVVVVDVPDAYRPFELTTPPRGDWLGEGHSRVDYRPLRSDLDSAPSIPLHEPLVTRIVDGLLRAADEAMPDALVGSYLEPYGVAAALASTALDLPLGLIHAGSDIDRLAGSAARRRAYSAILQQADLVLSTASAEPLVRSMGVDMGCVWGHRARLAPRGLFSPTGPSSALSRTGAPVLGVVGKLGPRKGSTDLLRGVAIASERGLRVEVAVLSGLGSPRQERFDGLARELGLAESISYHQFVPPWDVPSFYRGCAAVAFLENRFPVGVHRPQVPLEVLGCGVPLVLSKEIWVKIGRPSTPGVYLVDDPQDHQELASAISAAIGQEQGECEPFLLPSDHGTLADGWVDDLATELGQARDDRRNKRLAIEKLQDVGLQIFSSSAFRRQIGAVPATDLASHLSPELDPTEVEAIAGLLADPHLERYCQSLINKKLRFLRRRFAALFRALPALDPAVANRFQDWEMRLRTPEEEFHDFADLCRSASAEAADIDSGIASDWIALALARALVVEADGLMGQPVHDQILLNPTVRFLELSHRLLDEPPSAELWSVIVWKDRSDSVRMSELARPLALAIGELAVGMSRASTASSIATASGVGADDAEASIEALLDMDVLLVPEPLTSP